jgi:MinD-like ATPase involved in chromosome partitioning or flagellar assembly
VIVRLALLGGDAALEEELRAALAGLPEIALLAAAHSADADMLLAADSSRAAAGDLVRAERARRSDVRILLVAPAGAENAAQQALGCGAVGIVERPIDAPALRQALAAAGCFDAATGSRALEDEGHIALLGAAGGMGTTTCAVALAAAHKRVFLLDLALATGDAADVAAAHVAVPDALLRLACGPVATPAELTAGLAHGDACQVLPAPSLPEHADLIDERGIARVLDLALASGLRAIVDCGARVGVETIPVLERASIVVIVASADARGARGARRAAMLIARLGLSARLAGIVATGSRSPRAARSLAALTGLPLVATVKADSRVPRARERGLPPPGAAFAALVALAGVATR